MKALRIHECGGSLRLENMEDPAPGAGEVVIRVAATTLNPIDTGRAKGIFKDMFPVEFPWIPGGDASGVVESVGSGATNFAVGDEVFGYSPAGGAYAELMPIEASAITMKPGGITHEGAVAVSMVGQTALQALQAAKMHSGQTELIHGGAGGVGSLAVQLAHKQGMKVITTASSSQKDALLKLGADEVIDYNTERFEDMIEPVDIVIDLIGGDVQSRSYKVIKPGGYIIGSNQPPDQKECETHHIHGGMVQAQVNSQGLKEFAEMVVSGKIVPVIASVETLWNPNEIWAKRPSGSAIGKLIYTV